MIKKTQLTRTCSVCGIIKPLAAFLQVSSQKGTHYGIVCAACRSTGRTADYTEEDGTTATTDRRIGSKEKTYIEQEKKRHFKDLKELYIKEAQKRDKQVADKAEEKSLKKKSEIDHRKYYIETKQNQGFLGQKRPADPSSAETSKERIVMQQIEHAKNIEDRIEKQKQEDIIKQELQMISLDMSLSPVAGQTNQIRFQTDTFLKFKSWLGSSPLVNTLELLYKKNKALAQAPQILTSENKNTTQKESIEKYVQERIDTPSSSRRR